MRLTIFNRDFTKMPLEPQLNFEFKPYSKNAYGGCKTAVIEATGDENEAWAMINHLRAPVEILTDGGERVWWGFIKKITVAAAIGYSVDLDTMANRVAVAYTDQNTRYTTAWIQDADSVSAYGIKELLIARSDVSAADALGARDTALAMLKSPANPPKFEDNNQVKVTLECAGWLSTLDWRYYACAAGKEAYDVEGTGGREIGEDNRPILSESFQIESDSAWVTNAIQIRAWKAGSNVETGTPSDNLVVSLKADNSGVPGTTLASASIAAANIGTSAAWYDFVLSVPVTLNPATTYWIHVARSGAVNAGAYYMVDCNVNGGYPRGQIKLWNTDSSTWTDELAAWDLVFRVLGITDNTTQIAPLVTACGQFIAGVVLNAACGSSSNPYRVGDTTGLYELIKLLAGGSTNARRLLVDVTPERYLWINEEAAKPANPGDSYAITKKRELMTNVMTVVPPEQCLVGIWCHLVDVIPPTVDFLLVSDPSLFFIEEAEYDPGSGKYRIMLTRNQSNAFDIGGTVQG